MFAASELKMIAKIPLMFPEDHIFCGTSALWIIHCKNITCHWVRKPENQPVCWALSCEVPGFGTRCYSCWGCLFSETNWCGRCMMDDFPLSPSVVQGLFWCLEMAYVGKKGRKAKGRVGFKCPCLLMLTTEKVVELRLPLWSKFGKAGEDFQGRGEPTLGAILWQSRLLAEEKRTLFGGFGCVSSFRQRRMSNEDFINTSFKICAVCSQCVSDALQILKK